MSFLANCQCHGLHAPFPHHLVTSDNHPKVMRDRCGNRLPSEVEQDSRLTFIICASCGHWAGRRISGDCHCTIGCHSADSDAML
jgi:hypothetical protein